MGRRLTVAIGRLVVLGAVLLAGASCGSSKPDGVYKLGNPYQVKGRWYHPEFDPHYDQVGVASWYGPKFDGRPTANGETFDRDEISAAHPTLPMPSIVEVTNLSNGRSLELRVNDRGPFVGDRIIDLSQAAARELGFERNGTTKVRVRYLRLADDARGRPPEPTRNRRATIPATGPLPVARADPARRAAATLEMAKTEAPGPASAGTFTVGARPVCGPRFIQVGAFADTARAHQVAMELLGLSVPVSMDPAAGDRYARVRLGPITDHGTAETTLHWLERRGYDGAFIVGPDGSGAAC